MKHVLVVAFHYPPEASSSGVLRTLKYTRYLGSFGWRVTVVTLNRSAYAVQDLALERQIPDGVRVIRTRYLNVKRHLGVRGVYPAALALPDTWIGWWPWAVRAGRQVIKTDPVDLIYSTSPHATAHVVAYSLARRSGLRWVADFRDPWYEEPPEPGTPRIVHLAAGRLERRVVGRADRVVASTKRLRDTLAARYPGRTSGAFVTIPNGYDEADFGARTPASTNGNGELLIVHAGSLNPLFRDPRPVFRAVRDAADAGALEISKLRFRFFGSGPFAESPEMRHALVATGLSDRVEFQPRVDYARALEEVMRAQVLLLLQASPDTADVVPAKLFEYLRAGRPVLAPVGPGATAEVLDEVGGGWAVDPSGRVGLRDAVITAYGAWRDGRLGDITANRDAIRRFDRRALAGQLAADFDAVVAGSR